MKVGVLGSGNGACAIAFEWARAGHEIYMFDFERFDKVVSEINKTGGIFAKGKVEGFQTIAYAGHDIEKVLDGAEIILAVGPAYSTEAFGKACAPYAKKGQIFIVCPCSCMGGVVFKNALGLKIDDNSVIVAETSTLPYAARLTGEATVSIFNYLEHGYFLATIPRKDNDKVYNIVSNVHKGIEKADSVFKCALQNANPVIHPAVTTLNAALIQRTNGNFQFYAEGVTPAVGNLMQVIDNERIAIGKKLGLIIESDPALGYRQGYNSDDHTYVESYTNAPGFQGIMAQPSLDYRYYNEDVGYGLVFWTDLADRIGVPVPTCKAMIQIVSVIMERDYVAEKARTFESLGLADYPIDELLKLL